MHWLDRLAVRAASRPALYEPIFNQGWGNSDLLECFKEKSGYAGPIADIDIAWSYSEFSDGAFYRDGTFVSPEVDLLPQASRTAHVREVSPSGQAAASVVFMAAFNDHGYATRTKLATLLARVGIASLMLENPYYGRRRPVPGQPMRTVTDFFAMGSAAVAEGRSLLKWLAANRPGPVGITGYSMGGNIAALISATTPFPIATAALAAAYSPGPVWMEGALGAAIAWDALGGTEAREELCLTLGLPSALRFPPPLLPTAAVLANPKLDGYIPRHAFEDLHKHWPGSELRWIDGGHASTMLWRKNDLVRAIVDSFERLATSAGGARD